MKIDRHCRIGHHFQPIERFRQKPNGTLARDCQACEGARRTAKKKKAELNRRGVPEGMIAESRLPPAPTREFPGVDIDAIHRVKR